MCDSPDGWQILAAIGQIAAVPATLAGVFVALWLAKRSDRIRAEEDKARGLAQARLVLLRFEDKLEIQQARGRANYSYISARAGNHGDRPILDVYLEAWSDIGEVGIDHKPLLKPGEWALFPATFKELGTLVAIRFRWTDPDGREWCIDGPEQRTPQPYTGQAYKPLPTGERA